MTAREQTGDSELYRLGLAYNDFTNLLRESLNVIGHSGMICGNNVFRKHDVGGNEFPACYFCWCSCFVAESDKSSFSADFCVRLAAGPVFSAPCCLVLARDESDGPLLPE
jgi:hypothetical protein